MGVKESVKFAHDHAFNHPWSEHPPGSNMTKCWQEYNGIYHTSYNGQPWCGASNCVVSNKGGRTAPAQFISVYALYQWGVHTGRFHRITSPADVNKIKQGDYLIIGSPTEHEEFAMEDGKNGQVLAHGGNTSPGIEGNQFDGGAEAIKYRSTADLYGYVVWHDLLDNPKMSLDDAPVLHKEPQPQYHREAKTGNLRLWQHGPRIEKLQNALGMKPSDCDGYYGRATEKRVETFKKNHPNEFKNQDGSFVGQHFINFVEQNKPAKDKPDYPTLHPDDISGAVGVLQKLLNQKLSGENLKISNHFGDYTKDAVNKVRKHLKLDQNGIANQTVWDYLTAA